MSELKSKLALELEDLINRNFSTDKTTLKYLEKIEKNGGKRKNPHQQNSTI